jgi:hypothetical protein
MSGRLAYVDADQRPLDHTDTEKLRRQYLDWCHENGLTPRALAAA